MNWNGRSRHESAVLTEWIWLLLFLLSLSLILLSYLPGDDFNFVSSFSFLLFRYIRSLSIATWWMKKNTKSKIQSYLHYYTHILAKQKRINQHEKNEIRRSGLKRTVSQTQMIWWCAVGNKNELNSLFKGKIDLIITIKSSE